MDDDNFDEFLNNATHFINQMWVDAGGEALSTHDAEESLYKLNDTLTAFFGPRRPGA